MPRRPKEAIPPALRWEVWERDNFTCHYCGARKPLAIDHKIPESKGGRLELDNLVTSCGPCNGRKAAKSYEDFLVELRTDPVGREFGFVPMFSRSGRRVDERIRLSDMSLHMASSHTIRYLVRRKRNDSKIRRHIAYFFRRFGKEEFFSDLPLDVPEELIPPG